MRMGALFGEWQGPRSHSVLEDLSPVHTIWRRNSIHDFENKGPEAL